MALLDKEARDHFLRRVRMIARGHSDYIREQHEEPAEYLDNVGVLRALREGSFDLVEEPPEFTDIRDFVVFRADKPRRIIDEERMRARLAHVAHRRHHLEDAAFFFDAEAAAAAMRDFELFLEDEDG